MKTACFCTLAFFSLFTLCFAGEVSAANFTTTTSQAGGADWTTNIWQPGNTTPTAGNTYEAVFNGTAFGNGTANTRLRNLAVAGIQTFPGDSLQLNTNTEIRAKGPGAVLNFPGVGSNPGLILNGGILNSGDNAVFLITGRLHVANSSVLSSGNNGGGEQQDTRGFVLGGVLTGPGTLTMIESPQATPTICAADATGYSGTWIVQAGYLQFGSNAVGNSAGSGNIIVGPTNQLAAANSSNYSKVEFMYDVNSPGTLGILTLSNNPVSGAPAQCLLHQNIRVTGLIINGSSQAGGNYSYATLNATFPTNFPAGGSGSIVVGTAVPPSAPSISGQPAGVTNNEYSTVVLSVAASGTAPLTYQWRRAGAAIAGATGSGLVLTNTTGSGFTWSRPQDSGDYSVVVTGAISPAATSSVAHVVINPDTVPPSFVWAIATTNASGGTTLRINLSEVLLNFADLTNEVLNWGLRKASDPFGSGGLVPDSLSSPNTNEVDLIFNSPLTLTGTNAIDFVGPLITDRAQTPHPLASNSVTLSGTQTELVVLGAVWKYDDVDVDPGANWNQVAYSDTNTAVWKQGPGPFDAKRSAGGSAGSNCRDTTLYGLGTVGTCINLTSPVTQTNLGAAFFRTHFTVNGTPPANTLLLLNGKFDDAAIVYLNGVELWNVRVPAGTLRTSNAPSVTAVGDTDAQDTTILAAPSLQSGDNVLAVELHQQALTSSDLTMGLHVVAATVSPFGTGGVTNTNPSLAISRNATTGAVTITWPGTATLQSKTNLASVAWTTVTNVSPYTFTPAAGRGQTFFTLRQ